MTDQERVSAPAVTVHANATLAQDARVIPGPPRGDETAVPGGASPFSR
jgi:hypothetical protein